MTIREYPALPQVAADLLRDYEGTASSIISDCMDRLPGAVGLLPYHMSQTIIGTAFTVRTRAGDNHAIHAALKLVRPGDVMVVDGGGDISQALIGEIIVQKAMLAGLAGFVIDGAIRDVDAIRELGFPVYARAVTHRGPYKNGPGVLNQPVAVGGTVVMPGDLVVGDADGIVTLSPATAAEILPAVRAKEEHERLKIAEIRNSINAMTRRAG
ncbi:RraA family protein [Paracoccus litorisediminis]|uniref:Putative 4-hydroxy-4-methyl-2-oxoglutarate aldolase n=1 Tax=Paracoccus litorisediminis TaxID=2006130 RepID=A0A844HKV6_9RHOB|nr:RraA family protein [Paracoccus litorisediminis]MTH60873.1 RraA family protein [Paracoccus litorisediminis]